MASERRRDGGQTRWWLALIAGLVVACGGRASGRQDAAEDGGTGNGASANVGAMAGAGASSAASAGTGGANGVDDAPGTVTLRGASGDAEGPATPSTLGPCFLGFSAVVDGMQVELEAFVNAPGDYQGDPLHILYVAARLADGRTFSASTNSTPYGEIDLHVAAVSPRFLGTVEAALYDRDDPSAPPLVLSLAFDIEEGKGCSL